jgi:hypothetical protein
VINLTNTRDKCQTKYNNYMLIGDRHCVLLYPINNTRENCLTKYNNYMVIGAVRHLPQVLVRFSETFLTSIGKT